MRIGEGNGDPRGEKWERRRDWENGKDVEGEEEERWREKRRTRRQIWTKVDERERKEKKGARVKKYEKGGYRRRGK